MSSGASSELPAPLADDTPSELDEYDAAYQGHGAPSPLSSASSAGAPAPPPSDGSLLPSLPEVPPDWSPKDATVAVRVRDLRASILDLARGQDNLHEVTQELEALESLGAPHVGSLKTLRYELEVAEGRMWERHGDPESARDAYERAARRGSLAQQAALGARIASLGLAFGDEHSVDPGVYASAYKTAQRALDLTPSTHKALRRELLLLAGRAQAALGAAAPALHSARAAQALADGRDARLLLLLVHAGSGHVAEALAEFGALAARPEAYPPTGHWSDVLGFLAVHLGAGSPAHGYSKMCHVVGGRQGANRTVADSGRSDLGKAPSGDPSNAGKAGRRGALVTGGGRQCGSSVTNGSHNPPSPTQHDISPLLTDLLLSQAGALLDEGEAASAFVLYKLVSLDTSLASHADGRLTLNLSALLTAQGQGAAALAVLGTRGDASALTVRGAALCALGDLRQARAAWLRAAEHAPRALEPRAALATLLLGEGERADATPLVEACQELCPGSAMVTALTTALQAADRPPAPLASFLRDPAASPASALGTAQTLLADGHHKDAALLLAAFWRAGGPAQPDALALYATALAKDGYLPAAYLARVACYAAGGASRALLDSLIELAQRLNIRASTWETLRDKLPKN